MAKNAIARVEELQNAIKNIEAERAVWVSRGYDTAELDMDIANYKAEVEELLESIMQRFNKPDYM